MSANSNTFGHAFEYIMAIVLERVVNKTRHAKIKKDAHFYKVSDCWEKTESATQKNLERAAFAGANVLLDLEPRILENNDDILEIIVQEDTKGKSSQGITDVRDIVILRSRVGWEIGLSMKHNHFAVKHSRLSPTIDFGKDWFGHACSPTYWNSIKVIFDHLSDLEKNEKRFSEIKDKDRSIYRPVLEAFLEEFLRLDKIEKDIPKKLVLYLLGNFDFYKVIAIDKDYETEFMAFNIKGDLNLPSKTKQSAYKVPQLPLPTRIIHADFVPGKNNTIEICLDNGWQFTFRIHNAEEKVKPSLKFDIQLIGLPCLLFVIKRHW